METKELKQLQENAKELFTFSCNNSVVTIELIRSLALIVSKTVEAVIDVTEKFEEFTEDDYYRRLAAQE